MRSIAHDRLADIHGGRVPPRWWSGAGEIGQQTWRQMTDAYQHPGPFFAQHGGALWRAPGRLWNALSSSIVNR